jgi:fatty acyl-CoA reductase
VVINCAASVDFNLQLDKAVEINIEGALRMQDLAKECSQILIFTHVSTAYVNCDDVNATNEGRTIAENICEKKINPLQIVDYIKSKSENYLIRHTPDIIKPYPNTYTYTKNLSERLLEERRGDLPMVILRPSIVGASYREPALGWVDNLAALSGFIFVFGIGLVNAAPGRFSNAANFIPVDYVVNTIIAVCVKHAQKDSLLVCHAASPGNNPITH